MIPFGNKTVTLYHRENGKYTAYALGGCSWTQKRVRTISDGAIVASLETVCRIPNDQQKPAVGDLLVLGSSDAKAENDIAISRLRDSVNLSGGSAFRVQTVKDNECTALAHFCATGA